jgi:nitrate reductase NapAB chaperone NapD
MNNIDINETWDANGNLILQVETERTFGSLDPLGALATLLAVVEVVTVQDSANAIGLTPEQLTAEAEAWAAAQSEP